MALTQSHRTHFIKTTKMEMMHSSYTSHPLSCLFSPSFTSYLHSLLPSLYTQQCHHCHLVWLVGGWGTLWPPPIAEGWVPTPIVIPALVTFLHLAVVSAARPLETQTSEKMALYSAQDGWLKNYIHRLSILIMFDSEWVNFFHLATCITAYHLSQRPTLMTIH